MRDQMKKLETMYKVRDTLKKAEGKRIEKPKPIEGRRGKNQIIPPDTVYLVQKSLKEKNMTLDQIAKQFEISKGSVCNIKRKLENPDEPPKKKMKTGPKSVFDNEEVVVILLEIIDKNPSITLRQIVDELGSKNIKTTKHSG